MNRVILIGYLGKDVELRYTTNGTAVANFSMATTERWNDKNGQRQEKTEWHNIVVWGKIGETCNLYLKKGRQCSVEGKITTRTWDDSDGAKRYKTEIVASSVEFLGTAKDNEVTHVETTTPQPSEENLPF